DDKSFSDEDIPKGIYSNPLFDEEIISIKIDPHHFSAEFDLIESPLIQDSLIISSCKIDSFLDEFASILRKSIPLGIHEADCDPEEEIRLIKKLLLKTQLIKTSASWEATHAYPSSETQTVESPIPTVSSPVPTACLNNSPKPSSEARLISKRVANQKETPSPIPTASSPVPTACLNDSSDTSSEARLVSKRVAHQEETPSLDNILSLTNRFDDILGVSTSSDEIVGVEADVSNMETSISASPTPTLRIHKDHPKSQIIGHVDTPIQTRHKSKMVEEHSFMAIIHQKTDPALLQFCLYSCFLSQVEPKRVSDALQDPSWVEAMQEELVAVFKRKLIRASRNQDNKKNESSRRSVPVETSTSTSLVSCDGLGGYDWSDQTGEGPNYVLMAFSSLRNFMPPTPDLSFTGLDKFVNEPIVENRKAMSSKDKPKVVRKYDDAPSIEEWVSDDEEEDVSQPKIKKQLGLVWLR
nr:hypothetical protein [Tanacetum cinerariifolium]